MRSRVGVFIHEGADLSAPFFSELLTGMREGADGLSLHLNPDGNESLDGFISVGPEGDDPRLERARSLSLPLVVVAGRIEGFPSLDVDNQAMAEKATTHLLATGRKQVALINGKMETSNGRDRAEGFQAALKKADLLLPNPLQFEGRFSREGGRTALETFLRSGPCPNAIFSANDHMALGAWDVLERHGIRVPDDVALVGIDNIPEAAEKGLTSVQQPLRELGQRAAEQINNWIRTAVKPTPNTEAFAGTLIPRHSSHTKPPQEFIELA